MTLNSKKNAALFREQDSCHLRHGFSIFGLVFLRFLRHRLVPQVSVAEVQRKSQAVGYVVRCHLRRASPVFASPVGR